MRSLLYSFDELPLITFNGIQAALTNGQAEVQYNSESDWQIISVSVEGYRDPTEHERRKDPRKSYVWDYAPVTGPLSEIILSKLNGDWRDRVCAAVAEQIEQDAAYAADDYADFKRDQMRETV